MSQKKRVGIIAANNIRLSPYIYFYKAIFDDLNIDYELIYPDRNLLEDIWEGTVYKYTWHNNLPGLINYALYAHHWHKIIKERKYSQLIVLTSINAVYSCFWLNRHYKSNCIIDIRDYTYEKNKVYFLMERIAFKSAAYRVISSARFTSFLPSGNYLMCHNLSVKGERCETFWKKKGGRITISYIGAVSYFSNVKKLAEMVLKDERFNFYIYGGGIAEKSIEEMTQCMQCDRIQYFGKYKPEEKRGIILDADILFNCYGNGTPLLTCALSNKLYDGMYYRKLVLNSPDTFMEEMCGPCGYSIDLNNRDGLNELYNWYQNVDAVEVTQYQNNMIDKFFFENESTIAELKKYFSS